MTAFNLGVIWLATGLFSTVWMFFASRKVFGKNIYGLAILFLIPTGLVSLGVILVTLPDVLGLTKLTKN